MVSPFTLLPSNLLYRVSCFYSYPSIFDLVHTTCEYFTTTFILSSTNSIRLNHFRLDLTLTNINRNDTKKRQTFFFHCVESFAVVFIPPSLPLLRSPRFHHVRQHHGLSSGDVCPCVGSRPTDHRSLPRGRLGPSGPQRMQPGWPLELHDTVFPALRRRSMVGGYPDGTWLAVLSSRHE